MSGPDSGSQPGTEPGSVRPYLLTGGRVGPAVTELEIEAQVLTTAAGLAAVDGHRYERLAIVLLCQRPRAIAEVAAQLRLHLGVARVIIADLVALGHVTARRPEAGTHRDAAIIERVIRGLQSIR